MFNFASYFLIAVVAFFFLFFVLKVFRSAYQFHFYGSKKKDLIVCCSNCNQPFVIPEDQKNIGWEVCPSCHWEFCNK